jgi:hypothetical protein
MEAARSRVAHAPLEPRCGIIMPETWANTNEKGCEKNIAYLLELLDGTSINTTALVDQVWTRVSVN